MKTTMAAASFASPCETTQPMNFADRSPFRAAWPVSWRVIESLFTWFPIATPRKAHRVHTLKAEAGSRGIPHLCLCLFAYGNDARLGRSLLDVALDLWVGNVSVSFDLEPSCADGKRTRALPPAPCPPPPPGCQELSCSFQGRFGVSSP